MLYTQVALVLIDEVHLLNESRGAALEAGVVSRIKMIGALPSMSEVVSCSPREAAKNHAATIWEEE
jgi:superfamily II helicase